MTRIALVFALTLLLCGCAAGRITPAGDLSGVAIGHAHLRWCSATATPVCREIQGGAVSGNFSEFLGALVAALGAWLGISNL